MGGSSGMLPEVIRLFVSVCANSGLFSLSHNLSEAPAFPRMVKYGGK